MGSTGDVPSLRGVRQRNPARSRRPSAVRRPDTSGGETMMRLAALRRPVVHTVQRRGFAGHGHAPPPVAAGDFVPAAPKAPSSVEFFGPSLGGWLEGVTANGTYASFTSRKLWPWAACFPFTFWFISKMGMSRASPPPNPLPAATVCRTFAKWGDRRKERAARGRARGAGARGEGLQGWGRAARCRGSRKTGATGRRGRFFVPFAI